MFIYAARRADGALTVIVINLSLKAKTKVIPIEKQAQVQAESWLSDPDHKAENIGIVEISNNITIPSQSITLYILP
ncbi:MAG TPA: hypothetical protein VGA72_14035 [Anaerolineales bacterium]